VVTILGYDMLTQPQSQLYYTYPHQIYYARAPGYLRTGYFIPQYNYFDEEVNPSYYYSGYKNYRGPYYVAPQTRRRYTPTNYRVRSIHPFGLGYGYGKYVCNFLHEKINIYHFWLYYLNRRSSTSGRY